MARIRLSSPFDSSGVRNNAAMPDLDTSSEPKVQTYQRWKNVQILQIYLCYFSLAVLIFCLYTRKLAQDIVLLALC